MGGKMPTPEKGSIAAEAEGRWSKEAALTKIRAERPWSQTNPFGGQSWREGPNGQWVSKDYLSPNQQRIFNRNEDSQLATANIGQLGGRAYARELGFDGEYMKGVGTRAAVNPYTAKIMQAPTGAGAVGGAGTDYRTEPGYLGANAQGKAFIDRARASGQYRPQAKATAGKLTPAQVAANAKYQKLSDSWEAAQAKSGQLKLNTKGLDARKAELQRGANALAALDKAQQANLYQGIPTFESFGEMPTADAAGRQRAEDAYYGRSTSRLNPEFDEQSRALNNRLAQMGFMPGSAAASKAQEAFGRTRNDAYNQARNEAIVGGGAEQDRAYNLAMGRRGQQVAERGQRLGERRELYTTVYDRLQGRNQEADAARQRRLNEYLTLTGGGQKQ